MNPKILIKLIEKLLPKAYKNEFDIPNLEFRGVPDAADGWNSYRKQVLEILKQVKKITEVEVK